MKAGNPQATQSRWVLGLLDRLSVRFALLLALALLPLGIVSLMQTKTLQNEIQRRTEAALLGETLRSAAGEIGLIRSAQGTVASLAASQPLLMSEDTCLKLMARTALQIPAASVVAFVPKSGLVTCSSVGRTVDLRGNPLFDNVTSAQAPEFFVNRKGSISGISILAVTHPVFAEDSTYLGYVAVSLPHTTLELLDAQNDARAGFKEMPVVFWTFDRTGSVLTASAGLDEVEAQLPQTYTLAELVNSTERVFQDDSAEGIQRTYASVPIVPGELYLMSSWDKKGAEAFDDPLVWPYLPPITMWIAGLIAAGFASERLVTRHIRVLNRSILSFAKGDRALELESLNTAPAELREVGEAFESMTLSIMRDEAELEDSVHQKEVLLREVHHRVKNNLQLIASIMNIQMRKAIAPEAKVLLKGLQDRVMSLATIHRGLYQTSGLADVRADELFRDIVRQIVNLGSGIENKFTVMLDVDDLHMTPDQAVPLSLFLTEAMTNAMKYATAAQGDSVRITVRLKRNAGGEETLDIINSLADGNSAVPQPGAAQAAASSTGLGEQLLTAFAQQIGGTLEREVLDGSFRLSVRFKAKPVHVIEEVPDPDEMEPQPAV